MTNSVAFITGGTGFIGSHLAEALLSQGYRVRCLVRNNLKWLDGLDVVPVQGDLQDLAALREGSKDADVIYHVAGVTRAKTWDTFEAGNIKATLNVLEAAAETAPNVRRVLITSSLAAVGPYSGGMATEETPLNPISRYGRSKAEMEEAVVPWHDRLPITVVRPPAVYGPREADIYTFFRTVSRGVCPVVGDAQTPDLSLVHVQDLVDGMIQAANAETSIGQTYFIGSERPYSWAEIKAATCAALGRKAMTIPVPPALLGVVGAVAEFGGRLMDQYPPLTREKAREIRYTCKMCSSEKAQSEVGYTPRIGLEDGIRETIAWYRTHGWLK